VNYLLVTVSSKIVNDSHFLETSNLIYFVFIGMPCLMIITYCWCGGFLSQGGTPKSSMFTGFSMKYTIQLLGFLSIYIMYGNPMYIYIIIYVYNHIYIYTKESIIYLKMFFSIRNRMSWIPWPRRCTGWWSFGTVRIHFAAVVNTYHS